MEKERETCKLIHEITVRIVEVTCRDGSPQDREKWVPVVERVIKSYFFDKDVVILERDMVLPGQD